MKEDESRKLEAYPLDNNEHVVNHYSLDHHLSYNALKGYFGLDTIKLKKAPKMECKLVCYYIVVV